MKERPSSRLLTVLAVAVCIALLAFSAFAQSEAGNIYGKVQGKDGSALPGVSVTLTGNGAPQTQISDAGGNFRFIGLSPGTYALKAELAGLGTSTRTGVGVNLGRNSDVTMTLNPTVAESITVTAGTPLLDIRKTGDGSNISQVELKSVPTARDPWVILQQTPGVLMDRNNVGGNESGQQSVYISKGAPTNQGTWNVDGVNITDFSATGSSPAYYDFEAFEEMQITTSGTDPRIQTPGAQVNMVTKRGTNDFKGSAHGFKTSSSYQATPKIPTEAAGYLASINQIDKINDNGGEVGGPILKDKLWFWGAYGDQKINILTSSIVFGSRFHDTTELKNENLKFNAQPIASNSLTVVDQYGAKVKIGRSVGPTRLPETAWDQNDNYAKGVGSLKDPTLWKIEDTQLVGSNLYFTALYSKVQGGFQLIANNGVGCATLACGLDSLPSWKDEKAGTYTRSYLSEVILRPQKQYRLDGSAFVSTGSLSHELKFGYGYREATSSTLVAWPGAQYTQNFAIKGQLQGPKDPATGLGRDTGRVFFMRPAVSTYGEKTNDLYVGDTMLFGNLTVNAALRYDKVKGFVGAGVAAANPNIPTILPEIDFPSVSAENWKNISPRLGLTYALGADRRTLLRGSYSRYVNQLAGNQVTPVSPGAYSGVYYYFNDINKNNSADPGEIDFAAGNITAIPASTAKAAATRLASGLKAPTTDEFILGGERELMGDFSVGINGTYRKYNDFINTVGEHTQGAGDIYSSADYVLNPVPLQATLPNGTTVSLPYYNLKPGIAAARFFVIRNLPDYSQEYKGLELTATKRMANRWMLRGNFTMQDWTQQVGSGAIVDPTRSRLCSVCDGSQVLVVSAGSGSKGSVYFNSKWAYSLTGAYQIPIVETSFGFNLNGRQGYSDPYVANIRTNTGEGTKSLLAPSSVDSFRNDNVRELDLRLAKDIRVARVGLTLSIDLFNALNSNTILQRDTSSLCSVSQASLAAGGAQCNAGANPTASSNHVQEVLSPRVYRLGARLSF
jgi:Carboxypeptidase regulatory-like domain